jgi:anti-anti-sigma factor
VDIEQRIVGNVVILDLKGRLILDDGEKTFRELIDTLIDAGKTNILVNFEGITYLDSAGVGAVVWKFVTLKRKGGTLKLLNLQTRSHRVLSVTKILTVLESFDSEAAALKSFS